MKTYKTGAVNVDVGPALAAVPAVVTSQPVTTAATNAVAFLAAVGRVRRELDATYDGEDPRQHVEDWTASCIAADFKRTHKGDVGRRRTLEYIEAHKGEADG